MDIHPILELKSVGLKYQRKDLSTEVLDNINLSIKEGEFVCVLGPSGCGKSSLLKLISGIETASVGEVLVFNEKVEKLRKECGLIFQNDNLFEWFDVTNNINYSLRMQHKSKKEIDERTEEMVARMGLTGFENHKVFELSGGMRQRVSIGRMLINDPKVLLMDEPFSALDAFTREELQDFLRDIWKIRGNTIIFVTHDIDEALVLGTKIVVLSKRPGTIMRVMDLPFSLEIANNNNSRKKLSNDYFVARREIYDLLCGQ